MLFNSFEFLCFLPIVFLIYWLFCRTQQKQNSLLLVASYVFYGWWSYTFLALIIATTLLSYVCAILIDRFRGTIKSKLILCTNIVVNLGILLVYKYFDFFSISFALAMGAIGIQVDAITLNLILPVGISFYTFQALSYCIDVYRNQIPSTHNYINYSVFIAFFPQLVAGPIERATNLLPQFQRIRTFNYSQSVQGMKYILWGLFKKMVVADTCAPAVDQIFSQYQTVNSLNLWLGAILFSFQIYCDFSGYSDIALGTARLFGIKLMNNFRMPYLATSINDFWKRWHISLTSWFRDYIYVPLGGNRKGKRRQAVNTASIFLLSGLWHGANFTFIIWGLYHAILFLPKIFFKRQNPTPGYNKWFVTTFASGITFLLVMIGWILFRSVSITDAIIYVHRMFSEFDAGPLVTGKKTLLWCAVLIVLEIINRKKETPFDFNRGVLTKYVFLRWSIYVMTFLIILLFQGYSESFIYFQF